MFEHYENRLFELEKIDIAYVDLLKRYDALLLQRKPSQNGHNDYDSFIAESWKPKHKIEFQSSETLGESKFVLKPNEEDVEFKKAFDKIDEAAKADVKDLRLNSDKVLKERAMYCVNVRDCGCKAGKCFNPIDISRQQELCDHQWGVEEGEEVCINCEMKKDK